MVAPWRRFAPAPCTAFLALGTARASPAIRWAAAVIAALGAGITAIALLLALMNICLLSASFRALFGFPTASPAGRW